MKNKINNTIKYALKGLELNFPESHFSYNMCNDSIELFMGDCDSLELSNNELEYQALEYINNEMAYIGNGIDQKIIEYAKANIEWKLKDNHLQISVDYSQNTICLILQSGHSLELSDNEIESNAMEWLTSITEEIEN